MNAPRRFGLSLLVLAVILAASSTGCGGKKGPATGQVHGKVTFKGTPVTAGRVNFHNSTAGRGAEADLDANGSYVVDIPLEVGEYVVFITPLMYMDPGDRKTPPSPVEKPAPNIPTKYRAPDSTPLKMTIKEGKQEASFNMLP